MIKSVLNPKVDQYIGKAKLWREEMEKLRTIILDCGLTEEFKWGKPCYTFQGTNLVVLQDFKQYFALLFFKGMLLRDPKNILVKTGENTRVGRQVRFANVKEITKLEPTLKAYIKEAVEKEKAGVQVEKKVNSEPIPEEFQKELDKDPKLKAAFKALTPGRQRAYNMYFAAPRQTKTRESRIEKCLEQIMNGKGLND